MAPTGEVLPGGTERTRLERVLALGNSFLRRSTESKGTLEHSLQPHRVLQPGKEE